MNNKETMILEKKDTGINSKGILNDFANEYNGFITAFNMGGLEEVKKWIKEFKTENANFTIPEYGGLVNEKNKEVVGEINKLILELNEIFNRVDDLDEKEFARIINNLNFLIYERHDENMDINLS
jgi:hypothetical protein